MARSALRWSLDDAAHFMELGKRTVQRMEDGPEDIPIPGEHKAKAVIECFRRHGVEFINDDTGLVGVTLRRIASQKH